MRHERKERRSTSAVGRSLLDVAACALVGGMVAACFAATGDTLVRTMWGESTPWRHFGAVLALFVVVGAILGCAIAVVAFAAGALHAVSGDAETTSGKRRRIAVGLALCAVAAYLAPLATADTITASLAGAYERAPEEAAALQRWAAIAIGAAAAVWLGLLQLSAASAARRRLVLPLMVGVSLLGAAGVLGWADLTMLVALYARAHDLAEALAWLLATSGAALLGAVVVRRFQRARAVAIGIAALAALWSVVFLAGSSARTALDARLTHIWREPGYAARMCLRLQMAEDYLRDPSAWKGKQDSRLARLIDRYDIVTVDRSAAWDLPRRGPAATPRTKRPFNVVVVLIDTLRGDVASDAQLMPRLDALRATSLDYTRAYAAASDTVSVLPVLTGGCYQETPCPGDILSFTRDHGIRTGFVTARSANRFLQKLAPHFVFDDVMDIPDYDEGKEVWGYGADRPTAAAVTEEALRWIDDHRDSPFLMWAHHFDIHNWMHLDEAYLGDLAQKRGIAQLPDDRTWRYFAASAGVDDALGQLIDGLRARGMEEDTALLVVSDHGEALGLRGHAYHAVHLWQPLIHVPLVLRVPGLAPAKVTTPVGHVDIAPTLAQLFEPNADVAQYHGASLIGGADDAARKLPLLLYSMRKEEVLRLAVIDRTAPHFKLDLPLDSVEPELYDLDLPDPDVTDLRREQMARTLGLLSELVTSPIFPRPDPDDEKPVSVAQH